MPMVCCALYHKGMYGNEMGKHTFDMVKLLHSVVGSPQKST